MKVMTSYGGPFQGVGYIVTSLGTFPLRSVLGAPVESMQPYTVLALLGCICVAVALGLMKTEARSMRMLLAFNVVGPLVVLAIGCYAFKQNPMLWPRYLLFFT